MEPSKTPNDLLSVLWRAIVVLISLLILLAAYYWVHKPINFPVIQSLGGAIVDLLTVCAITVVAGGTGRRALTWLSLDTISSAERVALEGAIGLGLISSATLIAGMLGLYRGIVLWPGLLLLGFILRRDSVRWGRDIWDVLSSAVQIGSAWLNFLTVVTFCLLSMALIRALMPPVTWDALTYHMVAPKLYLAAGRIVPLPDNPFMGFPQLVENLYGLAMSLVGRDTAAAPIHFLFGLFAVLSVAGITRRYVDGTTARLAVLILIIGNSVWLLFGEPYIDLAVMAYGALVLTAVSAWHETRKPGWLIVSGIIAGQTLSTKYTSVLLVASVIIYLVQVSPRQALTHWIIVGITAFLVFIPWAIKGLVLYHNPVYPFFFGGINWDALHAQQFSRFGDGLLSRPQIWQLPILPVAATIFGLENGSLYSFTLGPWLLTLPLLLIVTWPWLEGQARRLARECMRLGLPLLALWMIMAAFVGLSIQTRLVVMLMPIAAVAGSIGFHGLSQLPKRLFNLDFIVRIIFAFTVVLAIIEMTEQVLQIPQVLFGTVDRNSFIYINLGGYYEALRQFDNVPAGSRVLLMWEPRSYYCPVQVNCIPDILFDHWSHSLKSGRSPSQTFQDWRQQGIDFILLWHNGYDFELRENKAIPENSIFGPTLKQHMTQVWSNGEYSIYKWTPQESF